MIARRKEKVHNLLSFLFSSPSCLFSSHQSLDSTDGEVSIHPCLLSLFLLDRSFTISSEVDRGVNGVKEAVVAKLLLFRF